MLFDIAIPASITTPISDITFRVVPVITSVSSTPEMPGGSASRMINGSMKERNCATRIRNKSTTESARPMAKLLKDALIASALPRTATLTLDGIFRCWIASSYEVRRSAQVLARRAGVDVELAANLIMVHFRWRLDALDAGDHIEPGGRSGFFGMQRNRAQILDRGDLRLRILNGQEIVVSVARDRSTDWARSSGSKSAM